MFVCWKGVPSSEGDPDIGPQTYVWGTTINVQDLKNAVARFFKNFVENTDDLEGKYMRLLDQVNVAACSHNLVLFKDRGSDVAIRHS